MGCEQYATDTVPWSEFIPNVALYTRGAPDDVLAHFVRVAAIEFVRRTKVLKRTIVVPAQAGVPDYTLELEDGYTVLAVHTVCVNGRPVARAVGGCQHSRGYVFRPPWDIEINPAPACDEDRITVEVHALPGQDSCEVDRLLYDQFAQQIADGAIMHALLTRGASWYDAGLANTFRAKFYASMRDAAALRHKRHSTAPTRARARAWF